MKRISGFFGPNRWLSNFWPCEIEYEGIVFPSTEHAYQAAKTKDESVRRQIAALLTPNQAKQFGKSVKLRANWEQVKIAVMAELVLKKFMQDKKPTELGVKLLATGDKELVESNRWHDLFWGVCICSAHNGIGKNNLGQLLMLTRTILQLNLQGEAA